MDTALTQESAKVNDEALGPAWQYESIELALSLEEVDAAIAAEKRMGIDTAQCAFLQPESALNRSRPT